ncbi:MAG: hypothetical protein GC190_21745 [Alphaproteobacteria bacterium]|nr:hypothetical protein [Alphaproteobacteria bacterium]
MWPFDSRPQKMPQRWADTSLEFKGLFVYHIAMMVLFIAPLVVAPLFGRLPDRAIYLLVAGAVASAVALVSAFRRVRLGWHWRGAGAKDVLGAVITVALIGFFALSINTKFPPPVALMPWDLGLAGIALFAVLQILHVVHFAEADFRAECGEAASEPRREPPLEARWKRVVRTVFSIFFLAVWLEGVGFFYVHTRMIEHSAPEPRGAQTWSIEEHGRHHYVTREEYDRDELLKALMFVGIPAAMGMVLFMQFVLGIDMGWPTRAKEL